MLFSRPLAIDSALQVAQARGRVRAFATSRDLPQLEAFRRRQIIGWRLSEANEEFLFQPEYGETLDVDGARFVGLVEPVGEGSRIRGKVVVSPLTRIVISLFMIMVAIAVVATLREGREPAGKVLTIAAVMLGGAVGMVRYSLWSTSRLVTQRLRQCLEVAGEKAAA